VSNEYRRDPKVAEFAQRKANGVCQLCNQPAPFHDRYGDPLLENHHIIPRAEGGPDTIENVVALCPNCHRKMHILHLTADVALLKSKTAPKY
jgi:5-methylcytosine-specific restriction protein A